MKQLIVDDILNNLARDNNLTDDYIESVKNRVDNFITYTELPKVFQQEIIDKQSLPKDTKKLFSMTDEIIQKRQSIGVKVSSYGECGFLASTLIGTYLKNTILKDEHINTVLYIDTNLLLEDYEKLMDTNSDISPILVHSLDVLYREVENADFIIWDKFTMMQSNYEIMKIYDIISIRYRNCLGNLFFITPDYNYVLSTELMDIMHWKYTFDLTSDVYKHIEI